MNENKTYTTRFRDCSVNRKTTKASSVSIPYWSIDLRVQIISCKMKTIILGTGVDYYLCAVGTRRQLVFKHVRNIYTVEVRRSFQIRTLWRLALIFSY